MGKATKKIVSITINPNVWRKAKKKAVQKNLSLSQFVEDLLRKSS